MTTPAPGINVISWLNIAATPAGFTLAGGRYQLTGVATVFGSATLNVVGPDNSTLLPVTNAALTENGYVIFDIGAGALCQLTLAGMTGFFGAISQVPLSPAV